ncbi:MAG: aspartyl protease family protein [Terriglobales bacterium]
MRFPAVVLASLTLAVAASAAQPAAPQPSAPSFRFSSDSASVRIPIEVVADGLVFVHAKVNGHPGWFILDNAVQGFAVDRDYARRISLQSSGAALTRGEAPKPTEAGIIRDVQIALPGLDLTHRVLIAIELKSLEPAVGHEVDGIIGSRLFDDFVVVVDYERHWLSVYAPDQYHPSEKERPLPVRVDEHGFHFVDATVALPGIAPIAGNFLIDSGANTYLNIYKPFSDAHRLPPPAMKLLDAPGASAGATTKSKDGRADRIAIGPFSIDNPPVSFVEEVEGLMAARDHAGLIGAGFLQRFTVAYDSRGKRILLSPNASYDEPPEYDQSGLRIRAEGRDFRRFVVSRIVSQSPAADAGIEPGDIVTSIDSRAARDLTLTELRSLLRRPKARYMIGIQRGEKRLRVTLQLRPLL